ncbi:MAG: hypothetical protein VB081_11430 [Christensenella sp.]|uniref:hypothetical protein n=1 Tax=Christensenella sp. TaxID=1935934 RepID=UPI002B20D095|nr:hypothetical protein [Christensenella sp.]MEA5004098.1 hypothetical protein [Christensenella sp.]
MKRILTIIICVLLAVLLATTGALAADVPAGQEQALSSVGPEPLQTNEASAQPSAVAQPSVSAEPVATVDITEQKPAMAANAMPMAAPAAPVVPDMGPLTDISQLTSYFPDTAFRNVVYAALDDAGLIGNVTEVAGKTIPEILAMYTGNMRASGKGIKDIFGLQYLTGAESVNLNDNIIKDWTVISPSGAFSSTHYGYVDVDGNYHNVTWEIGKNPITLLPESFGGRLSIKQPATKSSYYPEKDALIGKAFIRDSAGQKFDAIFDIGVCSIVGTSKDNDFVTNGLVKLVTVNVSKVSDDLDSQHPGLTCSLLKKPEVSANNQFMSVKNILEKDLPACLTVL